MAVRIINGSDNGEQFNVVAPLPEDSQIYNGLGGNDVFVVNAGVARTSIYGTNGAGDFADLQVDVIQLLGSAQLNSVIGIDVLTFASPDPATTLSYNANSLFGVSQVVGSAAGTDTIHFTSASESVDLDLSKTTFVNWGRINQTILVDLNTDATKILDDRFVGSAAGERVTAGNGRDLLYGNAGACLRLAVLNSSCEGICTGIYGDEEVFAVIIRVYEIVHGDVVGIVTRSTGQLIVA